ARREVDDHLIADLRSNRVRDRLEILDLVARRAVYFARVDVDHRAALVHYPPRLRAVLLGRVRARRALLAVGQRARDRARDDDGVLHAHARASVRSAPLMGMLALLARLTAPSVLIALLSYV